jgi:hypothetical protein
MKNYKQNIESEARAAGGFKSKELMESFLQANRWLSFDNRKDITRSVRAKIRANFKKEFEKIESEKLAKIRRENEDLEFSKKHQEFLAKLSKEDLRKFLELEKKRGEISGNKFKKEK